MERIISLSKQGINLHHAYVLQGGTSAAGGLALLIGAGLVPKNSPDTIAWSGDSFGIDEARELKQWQQGAAIDAHRFYIIEASTITLPAQNALLRVLEEPTSNTTVILIVESSGILLDTVLSRVHVLADESNKKTQKKDSFIDKNFAQRLLLITPIAEAGNYNAARVLCNELEEDLQSRIEKGNFGLIDHAELQQLASVKENIREKRISLRMSLEALSTLFLEN